MASEFLTKVQAGKETTRGTAVAATKLLGAKIANVVDRKPSYLKHHFGVRSDEFAAVIDQYLVQETLAFERLYFQALPWAFLCGLKGSVTGSEVTPSQGDYKYIFTPSETAANSPSSSTIEKGDDVQGYEAEYAMFESYKIAGNVAQGAEEAPVSGDFDFFARQWTLTTLTPALSIPSMTFLSAKLARLYLDSTWAAVGSTELANALRGFSIDILTGVHPNFSGSANQYFNTHSEGVIGVMASFTVERNATTAALLTTLRNQSLVVARLKITGPQIGSGTNHSLQIDLSGTYEEVRPMAQADRGDNLDTFMIHGMYDATGAKKLAVEVVTNLSSIT
jgi:hypothetical protein